MNFARKVIRAIAAQIPCTAAAIARAKRQRERELRAAGYPRNEAKRIASGRSPPKWGGVG